MTQLELTNRLDKASRQYYMGENSEFTDTEFDLKLKELQEMEKDSGYVYPNSPTLRVGSDIQTGFKKGKHEIPMLTMENVYGNDGLTNWLDKNEKDYGKTDYNISVKYDGISLELKYYNGTLYQALTRGDKIEGDDVTENVRYIKDIPFHIDNERLAGRKFTVRGEVLMPKSALKRLNEECEKNGEKPFANTRNACSGSLKQLDPKVTAKRGLIFRPWDCFFNDSPNAWSSMTSKADFLEKIGFKYEDMTQPFRVSKGIVVSYAEMFKEKLDNMNLDYDYDGVVVKIDDMEIQNKIGIKDTRAIEWGIARKWNEDFIVETVLTGVDWQVGMQGNVTPVGRLEPVECAGVVITNVTLHNIDFINNLDLHIGDIVRITRSGGVIPYVLSAMRNDTTGAKCQKITYPDTCPVCGALLTMDGKILKCVNDECAAIVKGKILNFCSKNCMDIRTVGEEVVNDLYEKGLVGSLRDFICLGKYYSVKELVNILGPGYGEKKVSKILEGIESARINKTWPQLLASLSIPNVGKVMARTIASEYHSFFDLAGAGVSKLCEIDGIAETIAYGIVEWFNNNRELGNVLVMNGYHTDDFDEVAKLTAENADNRPQVLEGLTVCFTGKSNRFSGDDVEGYLESLGAKCTHSVSKSMNYLITGAKPGGSKVSKAQSYGIEVISEEDFYSKFGIQE